MVGEGVQALRLPREMTYSSIAYREVNVTIDVCTEGVCDQEQWRSYPNLAFFLSLQPDWNFHFDKEERKDLIASYVSSVGYPSNVHCYFHKDSVYSPSVDWPAFLRGESGSVKIGTGYFCVGFVLEKVIEYEDVDGTGDYNPVVDRVVSQFHFLFNGEWGRASSLLRRNVHALTASTKDQMITIKWASSAVLTRLKGTDLLVTPNATRMEVEINNYPFKQANTKLAIKAYIATDGVDEDDVYEIADQDESHIIMGSGSNRGYFSWANSASAYFFSQLGSSSAESLKSRVAVNFKSKGLPINMTHEFGLVKAILGTSAVVRDAYFSFVDAGQPSSLKWSTAAGYGTPPHRNMVADVVITGVLFLSLAVPAALAFFIIRHRNSSAIAAAAAAASPPPQQTSGLVASKPQAASSSENSPLLRAYHEANMLGPNSPRNSFRIPTK